MRATRTITLLAAAHAVFAAASLAATYTVTPGQGQEVVFTSKAPMESFEGRTDQASGTLTADLANLAGPCVARFEVDLASLKTGIGMRDGHMRERHLETDKHPKAVFTAERVVSAEPASLVPGGTARVVVAGTFDLHGVAKAREIPIDLALAEDGTLSLRADFTVSLAEHAIDRPKVLMLKLADEQKVRLALTARPAAEAAH